jgi:septum formation protein
MEESNMKIILASGSPRRKELLKLVVPEFDIMISGVDEKIEKDLTVEQQVTKLSYIKAKDIYEKTKGDRLIIGADTIVVKNNKIYGKPKDKENAKQIIKDLLDGDRTHRVLTGITVIYEKNGEYKEYKSYDEAKIFLKEISDEEI